MLDQSKLNDDNRWQRLLKSLDELTDEQRCALDILVRDYPHAYLSDVSPTGATTTEPWSRGFLCLRDAPRDPRLAHVKELWRYFDWDGTVWVESEQTRGR